MKSILIHAWVLHKHNEEYYIPYTHWVYINEIVKYFDRVCLISPVNTKTSSNHNFHSLSGFSNLEVYELPYSNGYISAVKYFLKYVRAYRKLCKDFDIIYARYPIPFGWLQKVFGNDKRRIIHYVGDPADAAINNPNFSLLKKSILTLFFRPENSFFNWACKGAKVYTNGQHIKDKLTKNGISATALVSSTLRNDDFCIVEQKNVSLDNAKFIYLGNLRTAKGVETIIRAFKLYNIQYPNTLLTLIGSGEFEGELKNIVSQENIRNVEFMGRLDDRNQINNKLRQSDIFLFASLSEGSPRVILEAMANGLAVISTPVGSLPNMFVDNRDLLFADYNDPISFKNKMLQLLEDNSFYNTIKNNGHEIVKDQKIDGFIKKIFDEK